jgi:hypothetical protein
MGLVGIFSPTLILGAKESSWHSSSLAKESHMIEEHPLISIDVGIHDPFVLSINPRWGSRCMNLHTSILDDPLSHPQ